MNVLLLFSRSNKQETLLLQAAGSADPLMRELQGRYPDSEQVVAVLTCEISVSNGTPLYHMPV